MTVRRILRLLVLVFSSEPYAEASPPSLARDIVLPKPSRLFRFELPFPMPSFSLIRFKRLTEHCFASIRHGATTFPTRSTRKRSFHGETGSFA